MRSLISLLKRAPEAPPFEELANRIRPFQVVSADVFDTALVRDLARPEDVHLATGARAAAQGLIDCSPDAFREYRIEAEAAVRAEVQAAGRDEITLAAVCAHLERLGLAAPGGAGALARLEFDTERSVCRANESFRALLTQRQAGQRLIFVSDTALPGDWLEALLREKGYGGAFGVFASSDFGFNKHSGRLFPRVLEAIGCAPGDVIHLGDNMIADLEQPRAQGIAAIHLPQRNRPPEPDALVQAGHVTRLLHSRRRSLGVARPPQPPAAEAGDLARYATMLILGYSRFVLAEARRLGARRVFFLARDGYLPWKVAQRLASRVCPEIELSYLFVSRRSIVLPAGMDDLEWFAGEVAGSFEGRSFADVLGLSGIPGHEAQAMLRAAGTDPDARVSRASDGKAEVLALLTTHRAAFRAGMGLQRDATRAYLRQVGFLEPGPRVIADVGWRGSIQEGLQVLAGDTAPGIHGCYVGLWRRALRPAVNPANASGYLFAFGHPTTAHDIVADGFGLLELFFSAPHGSALNYEMVDGAARPVLAEEREPGASVRRAAIDGIEARCMAELDALDSMLDGAWPEAVDPRGALYEIEQLLTRPTLEQLQAFNRVPFLHGYVAEINGTLVNPIPVQELLLKPRHALGRIERAFWRGGAARSGLPWPIPSMTYRDLRYRVERYLPWA